MISSVAPSGLSRDDGMGYCGGGERGDRRRRARDRRTRPPNLLRRVDEVDAALEHAAVQQLVAELPVRAVEVRAAPPLRAEADLADDDVAAAEALPPDAVDRPHDLVRRRARRAADRRQLERQVDHEGARRRLAQHGAAIRAQRVGRRREECELEQAHRELLRVLCGDRCARCGCLCCTTTLTADSPRANRALTAPPLLHGFNIAARELAMSSSVRPGARPFRRLRRSVASVLSRVRWRLRWTARGRGPEIPVPPSRYRRRWTRPFDTDSRRPWMRTTSRFHSGRVATPAAAMEKPILPGLDSIAGRERRRLRAPP